MAGSNPAGGTIFKMYKQYHLFLSNGTSTHTLTYELEPHRPAQVWAEMMSKLDVSSLRKNFEPLNGIDNNADKLIDRLIVLVNKLKLPIDLSNISWDTNPQELLNRLHIHFPELEKNVLDSDKKHWLTEYNDIIHKLEDIERNTQNFIWLHLLPESDHIDELSQEDFRLFTASRKFGDLCLHYPHVGRHFLELVKARDFDCPIDQIVTQTKITAYHTCRFYDDVFSEEEYQLFLKKYLEFSSLSEDFNIEDPALAYGYIKLGTLQYSDKNEIIEIIKNTHYVSGWQISS